MKALNFSLGSAALIAALTSLTTPALAAGDAAHGAKVFTQRCAVCHANTAKAGPKVGPNLYGVVGRKAGSTKYNYSAALKQLSASWTPDALEAWLAAPKKVAPGTRMTLPTSNPTDRADVIAYLATLKN